MFIHYIIRYCLLFIVYCVVRLSEGKCTKAVVKYKKSANSVTAYMTASQHCVFHLQDAVVVFLSTSRQFIVSMFTPFSICWMRCTKVVYIVCVVA